MCGGSQKWLITNGLKILEAPAGIQSQNMDKSPENESLLPHRAINAQIILVLRHIPVLPDARTFINYWNFYFFLIHQATYLEFIGLVFFMF